MFFWSMALCWRFRQIPFFVSSRRVLTSKGQIRHTTPRMEAESIHNGWKPDQVQIPDEEFISRGWETHEASKMTAGANYNMLISAVVPRPIALITSVSKSGVINCSPFSFFGAMSYDPPLIACSFVTTSARSNKKKDTLANIEETKTFVINIMSDWCKQKKKPKKYINTNCLVPRVC
eukprot:m.207379 g.207379  ORF g.207379 m.207379 type:complete len:177 (+) comp15802_c0_seq32:262-792(+)